MEKMPILIFRPEIPYSESINVVQFFCRNTFFFSRKFSKTATGGHRHKMTKLKATSKGTRSLLIKSAEGTWGFLNLNKYVGDIDK